jgi:hypothetical protein
MKKSCKVVVVPYEALCAAKKFTINGKDANQDDFGYVTDMSPETAEPYGCGDSQFIKEKVSLEVLKKYNITEEDYDMICDKLSDALSFGTCGWCV